MTITLVRKQVAPAATTPTTLYTVPAATSTAISTILVCNRSSTPATYRIAIRALGAAVANEHYCYYDCTLAGNDTFAATLGQVCIATDIIEVYASTANLTFQLSGSENT